MLFTGHEMRFYIQERIIDAEYDYKEPQEEERTAVVLLDYKMKFESIRLREKTTNWNGQKGLSWHGCLVQYRSRRTAAEVDKEKKREERM